MNLAQLFFTPVKEPNFPFYQNIKVSDEPTISIPIVSNDNQSPPNNTNSGFRKIKKESDHSISKDEGICSNKINNPFTQTLPQTMMKLLQIISQKNQALTPDPNPQASKIAELLLNVQNKHQEEEPKLSKENKITQNPNNNPLKQLQNVLLVNGNNVDKTSANVPLQNKNLYVDFLASLYKQNKIQKSNEELNLSKLLTNKLSSNISDTFNYNSMKKENSQTNGSFSHEEGTGDDALSNSNETLRLKSKKIKKINLLCGHYTREHYAKNLCNNCYHKYGRTKKPWNCNHEKLYAHGLCQNCYINKYNQEKKNKVKKEDFEKIGNGVEKIEEETDSSKENNLQYFFQEKIEEPIIKNEDVEQESLEN